MNEGGTVDNNQGRGEYLLPGLPKVNCLGVMVKLITGEKNMT